MRIDTKVDQNKKHLHYMRDTEKTIVTDRLLRHRDIHTITYLPSDRHIHTTTHTLTHSHTDTHTHTHRHTHTHTHTPTHMHTKKQQNYFDF